MRAYEKGPEKPNNLSMILNERLEDLVVRSLTHSGLDGFSLGTETN
jgi:hypothetical protein